MDPFCDFPFFARSFWSNLRYVVRTKSIGIICRAKTKTWLVFLLICLVGIVGFFSCLCFVFWSIATHQMVTVLLASEKIYYCVCNCLYLWFSSLQFSVVLRKFWLILVVTFCYIFLDFSLHRCNPSFDVVFSYFIIFFIHLIKMETSLVL